MNCNCILGTNSYERLSNSESSLALSEFSDDVEDVKEAEIDFYNEDGSCKTIVVEENLRTSDLCQLLALKNHVAKDANWSVVEYFDELGLERTLEDHEEVLKIYLSWRICKQSNCNNRFYFRKDFRKYEILNNPIQFFPFDMIEFDSENECLTDEPDLNKTISLQLLMQSKGEPPKIFGHLWIQRNLQELWKKAFFLLHKNTLYYSFTTTSTDPKKLNVCADLYDYNVYNFVKYFKIPTEFGFCFKFHDQAKNIEAKNIFFACDNEKVRTCWIAGFRLAKYGKQLRDNFKNLQPRVNSNGIDFSSLKVSEESTRSRVAMDFTGDRGKIVDDPNRARAIAVAEGYNWNKKVLQRKPSNLSNGMTLDYGVHITQPWFHSGLSREAAVQLLTKHGTVNGVFLVRESRSTPNIFVLSFVCNDKINHYQILPIVDNEHVVYSMDNGKTKFYDVLQLVEFHQLNYGCLPSRLTHYIVQTKSVQKESL